MLLTAEFKCPDVENILERIKIATEEIERCFHELHRIGVVIEKLPEQTDSL